MIKFNQLERFFLFFVIFTLYFDSEVFCSNSDIITHDAVSSNGGYSPVDSGNAGGANCHFPFFENGNIWYGCDTSGDMPWCGVVPDLDLENKWGYCSFPECRLMELGTGYRGDISVTKNGSPCRPWSSWLSTYTMFESDPSEVGNKCRNPDLDAEPWCWNVGFGWGFCSQIPMCEDLRYSCRDSLSNGLPGLSYSANSSKSVGAISYSPDKAIIQSPYAWCSETNSLGEWLQVDLGKEVAINGVVVRGLTGSTNYVTTYRLELSFDGITWTKGNDTSLAGSTDSSSMKGAKVLEFGRYVRVYPLTWSGDICLRVDFGGCSYSDACRLSPCLNNGSCIANGLKGTYQCICDPDFSGVNCHLLTDYCDVLKPCKNSGKCTNTKNLGVGVVKYTCECDSFGIFSGEHCEIGAAESCNQLRDIGFNMSYYYNLDLFNITKGCKMVLNARNISQTVNISNIYINGVATEEDCGQKCLDDPTCVAVSWMFQPFVCQIHNELSQIIDKADGFSKKINYYIKECPGPVPVHCDFSHPNKVVYRIPTRYASGFETFNNLEERYAYRQVYSYYPVTRSQIENLKEKSFKCYQEFTMKCKGVWSEFWKMVFNDFEEVRFNDPGFTQYCSNCIFEKTCHSSGVCSCRNGGAWEEDIGHFTNKSRIPIRMVLGGDTGSASEEVQYQLGPLTCEVMNEGFVDGNQCLSNPCWNGTCIDENLSWSCNCTPGYAGRICEFDTNECASGPCKSPGTLDCLNLENKFECVCKPGYIGTLCETDIDECASSPCKNGGSCFDNANHYLCQCRAGHIGTNCHIAQDECQSDPCVNAINCTDLHADYKCFCQSGWAGKNCDEDYSECQSSPCLNGGICQENSFDDFTCICPTGLLGKRCDINIDDCAAKPCKNQATCLDGINSYTCVCQEGFSGSDCNENINDCIVNHCNNGGSCIDGVNSWSCECASGYAGAVCEREIEECASLPCKNGASCLEATVGSYTCSCLEGYTGSVCETEINECDSEPCKNGGKCMNEKGFYSCNCVLPFVGTDCEFVITDGQWGGWGAWSDCSVDCGFGVQTRRRECNNPRPAHGGKVCEGQTTEVIKCEMGECSTRDGKWGLWKDWSPCSVTCSAGQRRRIRKCDNPTPINGADCEGASEIIEICKEAECGTAFDGGWSLWGEWSNCDRTCGPGIRHKKRACDMPKPQWGGKDCEGYAVDYETCQISPCKSALKCSEFGEWSECSETCGMGMHSRKRKCSIASEESPASPDITVAPRLITNEILQYEHKFCSSLKCPTLSCTVCVKKFDTDLESLENGLRCRGPSLQCESDSPGCLYKFKKSATGSFVEKRCAKGNECSQNKSEFCKRIYKYLIEVVNNDKPNAFQEDMEPSSDTVLQLWREFEEAECQVCCRESYCNSPILPPGNMLYSNGNRIFINFKIISLLIIFLLIFKNF